jgi:uncharacterized protein (TIGR03437 family)
MAVSNAPWITVTSGSPGSGPGTAQYTVANTGDAAVFRSGTLTLGGQTITLTQGTAVPAFTAQGVVSAASYQGGGVAPGELIAIFGSNLGPAILQQPAVGATGVVDTVAGGTRVLFDGTAAPIIYAVSGQVSAVVPFAIQGHASTELQVEFQGELSASVTIPVVNAVPALFTANSTGKGPASAFNQDASTVVIYATGGGAMTPAVPDGATIFSTLSTLVQPISARIGGVDAPVLYAGVAPGSVAGVLQINLAIPPALTRGSVVPVDVTIAGVPTQPGVTVVP